MLGDLGSAFRHLRRRPLATGVSVSILTIGLTASVAVFTYVEAYSRPFPGVDAHGLVRICEVRDDDPYGPLSVPDFDDYSAAATGAIDGLAAAQSAFAASVRLEAMTDVVFGQAVSGRYFDVVGIQMTAGRGLAPDDDRPGAQPVAVISYRWWRRRFGGDLAVLGHTVHLNSKPFTVVGVTSPAFLGTTSSFRPDIWIPTEPFKVTYTGWAERSRDRNARMVRVYGRLGPGARAEQAAAELASLARGLDEAYPDRDVARQLRVDAATWIDPRARADEAPTTRLMIAAAIGLLLLVCANVANLLLGLASGRRREMAVRAALGASPRRLARQVLLETAVLALPAGVVSLLLSGSVAARLGSYFARPSVWGANVTREVVVDLRVLGFAFAVSVLTALIAGALPSLQVLRGSLVDAIRNDVMLPFRNAARVGRTRLPGARDLLVATQVALSVSLLVVAGLLLRTLASVRQVDPGFSYDHLLASYISTSSANVAIPDRIRFFRELADRLGEEPWVRAVAVSDNAPLSPHASADMRIDGQREVVRLVYSKVLPGFFETLKMRMLAGRAFARTDAADTPLVAVVNESLVRRYFPDTSPIGRRVWWRGDQGIDERSFEIVGVVGDARAEDLLVEPEAMVYFALPQLYSSPGNALLVSTTVDPAAAASALEVWLRRFEPHLAIVNVVPYTDVARGFLYTQRMNAELFSVIALLALVVAVGGVFGVMSLAVAQRSREIGIRLAIGARPEVIMRRVVEQAMGAVALGLALGLPVTFVATRLVGALLQGVEPTDFVSAGSAVGIVVVVALGAAYPPARRAARVDPVTVLRQE